MLQVILEARNGQQLEAFLRAYGAPEVAAMCLLLITHPSANPSTVGSHTACLVHDFQHSCVNAV